MPNLRAAQKRMTRALLLESGVRIFQQKGYSAATIDDIAVGAGATRTTFYLHFGSKAELVGALIDTISEKIEASDVPSLTQVVTMGDREMIRGWVARRFDQWPEIMPYVTIADQAGGVEPAITQRVEAWHESAVNEIVAGLTASGRFAPADRKLRAVLAFAEVEYLSRRWARLGWTADVTREAALEAVTDSLYRQLVVDARVVV